jgi:hypothetical protein
MTPTQVRAELLRQHAELRGSIADVRGIAERASKGAAVRDDLHAAVIRLAGAICRHNLYEEEWLRSMDSKVDGPVRADIDVLIDAHVREHQELHAAVVGIPRMPIQFASVDVAVLLDGVLEHMALEEGSLFSEDVGHDDVIVSTLTSQPPRL